MGADLQADCEAEPGGHRKQMSRAHDKLAALPGVRPIRRPVCPASADEFDLYYVRCGRKSNCPLLVIPGGPGAASVALYRGFRRRAAAAGLDVIMVEHRGVGLSRRDDRGADLPPDALTIDQVVDDIAAVLDDAGVRKALVYGTSYGSYLAAGVGVRHADRVHAMVLDSPVLSARDIDDVRAATRRLLWDGDDPDGADLAPKVRSLVEDGVFTPAAVQLTATLYGVAGPDVLGRQLDLLLRGRRGVWRTLDTAARLLFERKAPYRHEPDLVGRIGYRELNFAADPDGEPLDPALAYHDHATTAFEREPYDLAVAMPGFDWPTIVLSGGRDLITPSSVAYRAAALLPDAVLVELPTAGHSILDFRERVSLRVAEALYGGRHHELPSRSAELDALPPRLPVRALRWGLDLAAAVESTLPEAIPATVRRATS